MLSFRQKEALAKEEDPHSRPYLLVYLNLSSPQASVAPERPDLVVPDPGDQGASSIIETYRQEMLNWSTWIR